MKSNLLKFPKPANNGKKEDSKLAVRMMIVIIAVLAVIKIFGLDDTRPAVYKHHDVKILESPIKLPEGYMVSDLSGKNILLNDLIGDNITIIAFWATWCGYCAAEFPEMDSLVPYLERHGIKILPIARGDDTPEKVNQFMHKGGIKNVQSVIASTNELHKKVGVLGFPTFVAVDKNGMVFAKLRPKWGQSDVFDLFEQLDKIQQN